MAKTLTDTQRIILSNAAMRLNLKVLPLPKSLQINGGAAILTLKSLLTKDLVGELPAERDDAVWRDDPELGKTTLVITAAGMEAIGVSAENDPPKNGETDPNVAIGNAKHASSSNVTEDDQTAAIRALPRAGSKLASLIALLGSGSGASISEIVSSLGWQAHSVRGAISGSLKKKLGLTIVSELVEGRGRVYRVEEPKGSSTPSGTAGTP